MPNQVGTLEAQDLELTVETLKPKIDERKEHAGLSHIKKVGYLCCGRIIVLILNTVKFEQKMRNIQN